MHLITSVTKDGGIEIKCSLLECGKQITVEAKLSESPFWDMYVGKATLVMLYHITEEHNVNGKTSPEGHANLPSVPDSVSPPGESATT